jgi:hypothetical protein
MGERNCWAARRVVNMFAGVSIEKVSFRNRYRVGSFCFDEPLIPSPRDVLVSTAGSLGLAFLPSGRVFCNCYFRSRALLALAVCA